MIFISILILIVALSLFPKHIAPILYTRISAIIFIYAGLLSLNSLYIQFIGSGIGIYSGLFHVTTMSQSIEIFLFIIGSLILIAWPLLNYEVENLLFTEIYNKIKILSEEISYKYSFIVLFSTLGSSLLISSSDLISLYLSIELQSFGLYILSTLYKNSESSTSAGLKYFLLGGLSSCIILLGAALIYSYTGITQLDSIYNIMSISDNNLIQGINLGLILIFVGLLFKIAAAPLHNWAPDVYNDTPTIVTIWLTIMPKISILIILLELYTQLDLNSLLIITNTSVLEFKENYLYLLKQILLISSLLSLVIGSIVGLAQTQLKRLLAYSTISHIGFMLLALAINTEQSIDSFLFYIIQYSITNLNLFLIIIGIGYT
jgi:NADH-ubiquinone oxidoreductase chain 2